MGDRRNMLFSGTVHLDAANPTGQLSPVQNPLIITFDDGYLDNWLLVFPLLKKYKFKSTIFISPEFVDQKHGIRSINYNPGFLSWDEMMLMEASGLIDIQSHTMTHTKYFVSEKIKAFHNSKADYLYPIREPVSFRETLLHRE